MDGVKESDAPWFLVDEVTVETIPDGEARIFMMALHLGDGRLIIVAEGHPGWRAFLDLLPICLPGSVPYPVWSAALVNAPLYTIPIFVNVCAGRA